MTPLSKHLSAGSERRLASCAIINGVAIGLAASQHAIIARAVLFEVVKRAAQGMFNDFTLCVYGSH